MSKVKILIIGPKKSGKSTIANILGDLQEGPSQMYRPTAGCRIVEFERDPPASVSQYGKINVELWDVSGDFKYEKCWAPIQQDVQGIMFVHDPAGGEEAEDQLKIFIEKFPKALRIKPGFCQLIINHHNADPSKTSPVPEFMRSLKTFQGTAEDSQGIFTTFEQYLVRLLRVLIEKQAEEESTYA